MQFRLVQQLILNGQDSVVEANIEHNIEVGEGALNLCVLPASDFADY